MKNSRRVVAWLTAAAGTMVYVIGGAGCSTTSGKATFTFTSTWIPTHTPTITPTAISLGTGVLAIGGFNSSSNYLSSAEFYDPTSNSWISVASMSSTRFLFAAAPVTIGGEAGVLAIAGDAIPTNPTPEFYNPRTNLWSPRASMPSQRVELAAAPLTFRGVAGVLAVGGVSIPTASIVATAEFYDPSADSWFQVSGMHTARNYLAAAPVTDCGVAGILAVGGSDGNIELSTTEVYDPTANAWAVIASMPSARSHLAAAPVTISGVAGVLAVGGCYGGGCRLSTAEFFNATANTWTVKAPMPTGRADLAAVSVTIGGVCGVLAIGGAGAIDLATAEFYNPLMNSWTTMASMLTARSGLAAAN